MADEPARNRLLSRSRLAELSGFSDAEVDELEQAKIIHATDGGYGGAELIKLQLVKQVAEHGGGLANVIGKYLEGGYSLSFLDIMLPFGGELSDVSYREALEKAGVPEDEYESMMRAMGLPFPPLDQPARPDEVEAIKGYAQLRALPIPTEARLHALRITSEGMRRAAEAQSELFRTYVVDPLIIAHKDRLEEGNQLVSEISARANPTAAGLTAWIYQRYLEHEAITNVTERMELAVSGKAPVLHREKDPAVAFVDLTGYTVLTADAGDQEAAELAQKFNDLLLDSNPQAWRPGGQDHGRRRHALLRPWSARRHDRARAHRDGPRRRPAAAAGGDQPRPGGGAVRRLLRHHHQCRGADLRLCPAQRGAALQGGAGRGQR